MTKPTREQLPFYNRFLLLLDSSDFVNDIETLRSAKVDILKSTYEKIEMVDDDTANADEIPSPLHQVMMRHNLPLVMEDFIYHYVVHDEMDLDKLRNGVYIIDHKTMQASGPSTDEVHNYQAWYVNDFRPSKYVEVTLAIPVDATITQITDTISSHKQFIRNRQTAAGGMRKQRVKLAPKGKRNNEIMRLYNNGMKPQEIYRALINTRFDELTAPEITKLISKMKKQ